MTPSAYFVTLPGSPYIEYMTDPQDPRAMLARVYKFEYSGDVPGFIKKHNLEGKYAQVDGYRILLVCVGSASLVHDTPVPGRFITSAILSTLNKLKTEYEKERIHGNESRQKKYLTAQGAAY